MKYYCRLALDNKIPLLAWTIIPYISYFLLFILAVAVLFFSPHFFDFIKAMIIAQLAASAIWYFFPNGIERAELNGKKITERWLKRLYQFDRYVGCAFPSAHTYHSLIIGVYLSRLFPQWQGVIAAWVTAIVVSTVLTKQHYAADVIGGILVTLMAVK